MKHTIVFYDQNCRLCQTLRKWFLFVQRTPDSVEWRHFADAPACGLDGYSCGQAMQVLTAKGEIYRGFYAVRFLVGFTWLFFVKPFLYLPGVPQLGEKLYAWVADNRYRLMGKDG